MLIHLLSFRLVEAFSNLPQGSLRLADLMFLPFASIICFPRKKLSWWSLFRVTCPSRRITYFLMSTTQTYDANNSMEVPCAAFALLISFTLEMLSLEVCHFLAKCASFSAKCVVFSCEVYCPAYSFVSLPPILIFFLEEVTLGASHWFVGSILPSLAHWGRCVFRR